MSRERNFVMMHGLRDGTAPSALIGMSIADAKGRLRVTASTTCPVFDLPSG